MLARLKAIPSDPKALRQRLEIKTRSGRRRKSVPGKRWENEHRKSAGESKYETRLKTKGSAEREAEDIIGSVTIRRVDELADKNHFIFLFGERCERISRSFAFAECAAGMRMGTVHAVLANERPKTSERAMRATAADSRARRRCDGTITFNAPNASSCNQHRNPKFQLLTHSVINITEKMYSKERADGKERRHPTLLA